MAMDLPVPRLESERLVLRGWIESDMDACTAFFSDEVAAKYVGGTCDRPATWRRMATQIGHWVLRGYGYWALEERATGAFVGSTGLWFPEGWPELELGYWLIPSAHGKGYATEAARRARRFAFDELGANTLISLIDAENLPSLRVAERLGARLDGTLDLAPFGPHGIYRHPREASQ